MSDDTCNPDYETAQWAYYRFKPSVEANIVFIVLFGITTLLHIFQIWRTKTWYLSALVVGGCAEFIGYIGRLMGAMQDVGCWTLGPYVMQNLLILIAPAFMAASIYMILGRIIQLTEGEQYALIRQRWLTKTFVLGDVTSLLLQASGGGMMAINHDIGKIGEKIIVIGLFVQLVFFGCFIAVAAVFHRRMAARPTARGSDPARVPGGRVHSGQRGRADAPRGVRLRLRRAADAGGAGLDELVPPRRDWAAAKGRRAHQEWPGAGHGAAAEAVRDDGELVFGAGGYGVAGAECNVTVSAIVDSVIDDFLFPPPVSDNQRLTLQHSLPPSLNTRAEAKPIDHRTAMADQDLSVLSVLSVVAASLTWTRVLGYGALFLVASFVFDTATQPRYPRAIPWMGKGGGGLLAKVRNSVSYFGQHRAWIQEGYNRYGKQDVAFVAPASISRPDDVVLPRSQIGWMMDQPDGVLSADRAHSSILHSRYNFLGDDLDRDSFATRAVHKYLARHLGGLIAGVEAEVDAAVDDVLGLDADAWRSVNLWDMWLAVVPRVTNRLLVGEPACREPRFLAACVRFVDDVIRNSFLLTMFPAVLHPLVGRLLAIPNWLHWRAASRFVLPTIADRLRDMARKDAGDPDYAAWAPPEDFLTWDIRLARLERNAFELDPAVVSKRMLPIQFAAIHTTALTGQSWMLDLLTTSPADAVLDVLRAELVANKPASGPWTKAHLAGLVRLDSSIRESQRLSNFAATLVERQVVAPAGLRNPTLGWTLPFGAFVTVNLEGTHHDEDLYPGARGYDPWRYSRVREAWESKTDEERAEAPEDGATARGLGMVTTSPHHLAFGHGRHACPGRFFVAHELKLIMAAILLKYDIKMIPQRPQPQWFGATIIPPLDACVEIRRKPGTV
ncbi:hypothetical protein AK830_g3243 [Neonectria ditissima]|uniref:Cytochrome P450 n=1 Tax=Neonectria ditissima TaxID=78410 RepID=A0A0P7BQL9_9HYPO|nr:hypothetical protein AK830_g3243 [Neonectria ditissima]